MEYFIDLTHTHLLQMRLLVEGGIVILEDYPGNKTLPEFDLIGEALYSIRSHICTCMEQLQQKIMNQPAQTMQNAWKTGRISCFMPRQGISPPAA